MPGSATRSNKILNVDSMDMYGNNRVSLYDMLDAKNQAANRKTFLNRVTFVSKLRNNFSDKSKLGEYYDKMFRNQQQALANNTKNVNPFNEKVTGISVIYPTIMVHVIESSIETIKEILTDLERMHADSDEMISETKILNVDHEIHIRLFPIYTFKMMNLTLESGASDPNETVDAICTEMMTRLLRMGKFLYDQAKGTLKKETIDALHETHPEFLPNQSNANFMLKSEELWTPKEYLEFYVKPFNIVLESDLTWPAPSKLFPYQ